MNPLNRFKKGSIIAHILHHAKKQPYYGSWLKDELEKHGYEISFGTLYPWLNRLEFSGYLKSIKKTVDGKRRIYYSITESGNTVLQQIRILLNELFDEIMEE